MITLINGETITREDYVTKKSQELIAEGFAFATPDEVEDQLGRVLNDADNGISLAGMYIREDIVVPEKR